MCTPLHNDGYWIRMIKPSEGVSWNKLPGQRDSYYCIDDWHLQLCAAVALRLVAWLASSLEMDYGEHFTSLLVKVIRHYYNYDQTVGCTPDPDHCKSMNVKTKLFKSNQTHFKGNPIQTQHSTIRHFSWRDSVEFVCRPFEFGRNKISLLEFICAMSRFKYQAVHI